MKTVDFQKLFQPGSIGLLSLHVYTATFRVAAIHVYKIGLPVKLVLA